MLPRSRCQPRRGKWGHRVVSVAECCGSGKWIVTKKFPPPVVSEEWVVKMYIQCLQALSRLKSSGAVQAVSREAYYTAMEGFGDDSGVDFGSKKRGRLPRMKGETQGKSLEALVKSAGKESLQWGLGAGVYTGVTYGLEEVRGTRDWKNAAIAGALTGASVALTHDDPNHDIIVQSAITGAALSTVVSVLNKML